MSKAPKTQTVKNPFCTKLNIYIVFWITVKRSWNLLLISKRVSYLVSTAPLYETAVLLLPGQNSWCSVDVNMMSPIPCRLVSICHQGLKYMGCRPKYALSRKPKVSLMCEYNLCPLLSCCYLISWASYLISLCFNFLTEKMWIVVSPLKGATRATVTAATCSSQGPVTCEDSHL